MNTVEKRKEYHKKWYAENKEKEREYHKEYYKNNIEKHKVKGKKYNRIFLLKYQKEYIKEKEKNKTFLEKRRKYAREYARGSKHKKEYGKEYRKTDKYKQNNIKYRKTIKYKERCRVYMKKYRNNPKNRIDVNMGKAIRAALKGKKAGRSWEKLVGYTTNDLIRHLEKQFEFWMNWQNYGLWQIDHIKPKSLFKYDTAENKEFLKCWSLENLQPLERIANISKGNRF